MANFADLLKKLANQSRLTPQELDELGRFGTEIQSRNAQVADWERQSFTNTDPTLRQLDFRTLGAKVKTQNSTVIATNTTTYFSWESVDYYDINMVNLTSNPTRITIPRTGRYFVGINFAFEAVATSYWQADIVVNRVSPTLTSGIQNHPSTFGAINISEDAILTIGDYVEARVYQNTGSNRNVYAGNMFVRWLGVN